MKQIIPFVKDLALGTRISEITSIALEHNLGMENNDSIVGNFIISGKYKINDISINEEVFEKVVPFDITLDDKYDAVKAEIDIDDFYYEIINDEYLRVHIDVLVNNLVYVKKEEVLIEEKEECPEVLISEVLARNNKEYNEKEEECNMIKTEDINFNEINKEEVRNAVFMESNPEKETDNQLEKQSINIASGLSSSFLDNEEKYVTYKVHIVRESETVEQIKEKYSVSTEELEKYNNLENIILGAKLIIPLNNE